jgi:MSHA biogenesis protein MshO
VITIRKLDSRCPRERGVTLIELVVVIATLGIIAAIAVVLIRQPLDAYRESTQRAELTDIADTALRRIGRDVRLALPNSIRVTPTTGTPVYMELLLTRNGGRYRSQKDASGAGDILDFTISDTQFDTLAPVATTLAGQTISANDVLVIFNLFADPTITQSNAYTRNAAGCATVSNAACNSTLITGTGAGALANEDRILFTGVQQRQFPQPSPGNRFHVVSGPVTFACAPNNITDAQGNGTGTLSRIDGYAIALGQATPPAGTSSLLAKYVTDCQIRYSQATSTQARGLVSLSLSLTRGGETVTLYHEIHVSNVP